MRIRAKKIDTKYLCYHLNSPQTSAFINSKQKGATRPRVQLNIVRDLPISLPPPSEQRRIVAILDETFAGLATAITNAEKNLKNARELFDSKLNSVFIGRGEGWVEKCLSGLIEVTHGYAFDGKYFVDDNCDHPILLTPGNFSETGTLVFSEKNTKRFTGKVLGNFVLDEGDLVVVMTDLSSKMKILGKPSFIDRGGILHNQRIGRIVFKSADLFVDYLYYFFRSANFTAHIKDSATGTMVKHTAPKRILNSIIRFPAAISEQKRIASVLDALSAQVEGLEALYRKKIVELSELKQSILQKAFSGELTPPPSSAIKEAAE